MRPPPSAPRPPRRSQPLESTSPGISPDAVYTLSAVRGLGCGIDGNLPCLITGTSRLLTVSVRKHLHQPMPEIHQHRLPQLSGLIDQMKADSKFPDLWERDAISGYIVPLLESLGWPVDDAMVVKREHKLGMGRVDFFLVDSAGFQMLLEAKRPSQNLIDHERQLLLYAFEEGIPLAALTNAREWWFYQSLEHGHWRSRKFCAVDLVAEPTEFGAQALQKVLLRSNVRSSAYTEFVAVSLEEFRQKNPYVQEPEEAEFRRERTFETAAPVATAISAVRESAVPEMREELAEYPNPHRSGTKMRQVFEALREAWVTGPYLSDLTGQKGGWQRWIQKHYVESGRYGDMLLLWKKSETPSPMHLAPRAQAEIMLADHSVSIYPD